MKQTLVLVVLDGWGVGNLDESNPIYKADPKTIGFMRSNFPCGALQASGMSVGLPYDEEGNSEVGHVTIGAGRVPWEHFPKISSAVEDGSFIKNKVLVSAIDWVNERKSRLHLVGLLTESNVHASLKHLEALIKMARDGGVQNLSLHLFSDGRDSAPRSFSNLLLQLSRDTGIDASKMLASVSGRYYAMDRDKHWDRTEKVYRVLTGETAPVAAAGEVAARAYDKNLNDEYLEPSAVGEPHPIADNDAVIFFNFREDRMRQIVGAFADPNFKNFRVKTFEHLYLATMTNYDRSFQVPVAFPDTLVQKTLGEVLAEAGKMQLRIAETEKYAHVTYFFNGLREPPFPNEYRVLIPSQGIIHHDDHPEMMAHPITDRVIAALGEGTFDFILVNYANADMVAHTGNYEATKAAVTVIDNELKRLIGTSLPLGHVVMVTSDHGNAEVLLDLKTGEPETKHDPSPVPFYLVGKQFKKRTPTPVLTPLPVIGMLSDVAPTALDLLRIPKPKEMTGQSLLPELLEEM